MVVVGRGVRAAPRLAWFLPAVVGVLVVRALLLALLPGPALVLPLWIFLGVLWVLGWTAEYQRLPLRLSRSGRLDEAARLARVLAGSAWTRTMVDAHRIDEAAFLVNAGRLEEAKRALAAVAPESLTRRLQPFYFDVQSVLLLKLGDAETALDMNRAALAMLDVAFVGLRPLLLFNQGLSLGILGRFREALDCLEQVADEELPDLQRQVYAVQRSLVALQLGRDREAGAWTARLQVEALPLGDVGGMLLALASGFLLRGHTAQARRLLDALAAHPEADPEDPPAQSRELRALAWIHEDGGARTRRDLATCPGWCEQGPWPADLGLLWLAVRAGRGERPELPGALEPLVATEAPFLPYDVLLTALGRSLWFPERMEAVPWWSRMLEALPARLALDETVLLRIETERALAALAGGDLDEAARLLDALLAIPELDPAALADLQDQRGWVDWLRGDPAAARRRFEIASRVAVDRTDRVAWLLDGSLLDEDGEPDLDETLARWGEQNLLERAWAGCRGIVLAARRERPEAMRELLDRVGGLPLGGPLRARLAEDGYG